MHFTNEITRAVTKRDTEWLDTVCIALRTLCIISTEERKRGIPWKITPLNCHSISRLISLAFKELTLVDGILLGMMPTYTGLDISEVELCTTNHSWLLTPDGAIIDPYPMGILAPTTALLLPTTGTHFCVHGGNMYHADPRVRAHFDVRQSWRNAYSYLRLLRKRLDEETINSIAAQLF